jgi:enoyl-CoA hydratase/carnithine racemase
LLTGQTVTAPEALALGVVNEVVEAEHLLARTWKLAWEIVKRPSLAVRYARVTLTQQLKVAMLEHLGYGLALEGLSAAAWPGQKGWIVIIDNQFSRPA